MVKRFAGFEFDAQRGVLRYSGETVPLQEQPLNLLKLLLERPGEIVDRQRIRRELWGRAHVDFEHGINTAVRKLRRALESRGASGISIATSVGRGYRIIIPEDTPTFQTPTTLRLGLRVHAGQRDTDTGQHLLLLEEELASRLSDATGYEVSIGGPLPDETLALEVFAADWMGEGRMSAELMDRSAGVSLWSAIGAVVPGEVLMMLSRLVVEVAIELAKIPDKPSPDSRNAFPRARVAKPVRDKEGHGAFLTGRFLFAQRNPKALLAAKDQFEIACERCPEFSLAQASLSRTCRFLTIFEVSDPMPLWEQAERHAIRAVELDSRCSEAQSSLACILARYRWRWLDGCVAYEKALRLNPEDQETLCDYGVALLAMGEYNEAVRCIDRVLVLDPRFAVGRATVALGWIMQGRREKGVELLTQMTETMPDFLTPWIYLGIEHLNSECWQQAEISFRRALILAPENPSLLSLLAQSLAGASCTEETDVLVDQLQALGNRRYVSPTASALGALAVGNTSDSLIAIARAVTERDANFALYRRLRCFDSIRDSREFSNTLTAMHLRSG
jgi:DNA-binding winged helix-turn-helix (wHTH) protein/tetratricopeptide (TPR) repeat protein